MTFTAETDQGPITGHEGGDPAGPAVLLLHGGPGLTDYMEVLSPELTGWRAVYYQQRGHAPSTTQGPFTVERNVEDALAVLDATAIDRAVLIGHSWGAHLALQLAIAYPGRVAGIIAIDGPGVHDDGGLMEFAQNLATRVPADELSAFGELSERLAGPEATEDDGVAYLRMLWPGYFASRDNVLPYPDGLVTSPVCNAATVGSLLEHLAGGFADSLKSVTIPVVFLNGGAGPMPTGPSEQAAASLPNATFRVLGNAGHLPWHEVPGCVAEALATLR